MSETTDLVSELVRERDHFKAIADQVLQQMNYRDKIIIGLCLQLGKNKKRTFRVKFDDVLDKKEYSATLDEDSDTVVVTIKNKPKEKSNG